MPPALQALHCWLDSQGGNGLIERGMARLCLALLLSIVTSCAPAFDRGSKSPEDFEHDDAQCLQQNSTKTAARYGASHHTDWNGYALCMGAKGYSRR
jgi:hypothetical protein